MRRALLVELAATDRFHRAISFPYLLGEARSRSAPCWWLRFGVQAAVRYVTGEAGVSLSREEVDGLVRAVREREASDVLFGQVPAPGVVELLRAECPGLRVVVLSESEGAASCHLDKVSGDPSAWREFLGLDGAGSGAVSTALPDFGYEAANEAARRMQPLPFVVLGPECTYNRTLTENPLFSGVDFSSCLRLGGCSFCARPEEARRRDPLPGDVVKAHLASLRRTLPVTPSRLAVRFLGEAALDLLPVIVEAVRELGFAPMDLLLDSRADRLVRDRERLGEAARSLEGTGHRLHVALVGIENFARVELDRMNKGVTPEQNLEAVLTLLQLERSCPATFSFREHGGLSLILYTPWTTLEDLAFNLRVLQACRLEAICGKALVSRLRLVPGLPLTELARRDGLLLEQYEDAAFDTAARNLYGPEIPWRFADARMESVCRVLVRLDGDTPLAEDDPLLEDVRSSLAAARRSRRTPVDLALAIVDAAARTGSTSDLARDGFDAARSLLQTAVATPEDPRELVAKEAPSSWTRPRGEASTFPGRRERLLVELSRRGLKPVAKVEPIPPGDVEPWLAARGLPNSRVRRRLSADPEIWEGFFGRDRAAVEEAVALAAANECETDFQAWSDATERLGRLLGYPDCCVRAFVAEPPERRASYAWMHLERRMDCRGPVYAQQNPWVGPVKGPMSLFVPCSLRCGASRELAERTLETVEDMEGVAEAEHIRLARVLPWLVGLGPPWATVPLGLPERTGDALEFLVDEFECDEDTTALVATADRIRLHGERIRAFEGDREVADLSARAYVWWHEEALQAGFWQRVLAIRRLQLEMNATSEGRNGLVNAYEPDPGDVALLRAFRGLIERSRRFWSLPEGVSVEPPRIVAPGELAIRLAVPERSALELRVRRSSPGDDAFCTIGPFSLTYTGQSLGGPEERRALAALLQALRRVGGELAPGGRRR